MPVAYVTLRFWNIYFLFIYVTQINISLPGHTNAISLVFPLNAYCVFIKKSWISLKRTCQMQCARTRECMLQLFKWLLAIVSSGCLQGEKRGHKNKKSLIL